MANRGGCPYGHHNRCIGKRCDYWDHRASCCSFESHTSGYPGQRK